mmetsp:Transcript_14605/g.40141  ORF Transcript_14605/g.40141 Transcript_14605/m.40141 type:complete len:81 (+) Transcript_14605:3-245(+)
MVPFEDLEHKSTDEKEQWLPPNSDFPCGREALSSKTRELEARVQPQLSGLSRRVCSSITSFASCLGTVSIRLTRFFWYTR